MLFKITKSYFSSLNCEKKRSKKQKRKGKIFPFDSRVPKNSKER